MADASQTEAHRPTPPYIAFQSIKTLAKDMKEHGVPGRIDRSVLTNFSGGVGSQIITALKFLKLTDDGGVPTTNLRDLVGAYGTEDWGKMVATVLRSSYEPIFTLDLPSASPNQFTEKFQQNYPAKDEVLRKCITFFLNATREAQIPISPYIMKNKKPRSAPAKKRVKADGDSKAKGDNPQPNGGTRENDVRDKAPPPPAGKTAFEVLMSDIYDPAAMDKDEESAVFTLARFLRMKERAK